MRLNDGRHASVAASGGLSPLRVLTLSSAIKLLAAHVGVLFLPVGWDILLRISAQREHRLLKFVGSNRLGQKRARSERVRLLRHQHFP